MTTVHQQTSRGLDAHAHGSDYVRNMVLRDIRRSEFLGELRRELARVIEKSDGEARASLKRIVHSIDALEHLDSTWKEFMTYFDRIHGNFLTSLSERHPELTETELRLCAFLRLPMTSKDVATIMGCSTRSVEKHRERLRKKFNLAPADRIHEYLNRQFGTTA